MRPTLPYVLFLNEYQESLIDLPKKQADLVISHEGKWYDAKSHLSSDPNYRSVHITAKFYIGIIKISADLSLVISPKIKSAQFLEMLSYIEPEKVNFWQGIVEGIKPDANFVDLFITRFLKDCYTLLNSQMHRDYSLKVEDRVRPKGKINFRKISNGRFYPSRVNCHYFEYNQNSLHNQILKYTLSYIRPVIPEKDNRLYINLLDILAKTTYRNWSPKEIRNISYNRMNCHYKPLHLMCILILEDFSMQFERGEDSFYSFLINSWHIFEKFLAKIFALYQNEFMVDCYYSSEAESNDANKKKPDIILSKNGKEAIFIDAKYKNHPTRVDENQILRYLAEKNLKVGYLIYPHPNNKGSNQKNHHNKRYDVNLHGIKTYYYKTQIDLVKIQNKQYLSDFVNETIISYHATTKEIDKGP